MSVTFRTETQLGQKPKLHIALLDPTSPHLADVVTDMHLALLPTSPAVLLGRSFLRDLYYSLLPAHGHIHVMVAYVNEIPAGFIAVTPDPSGFMGAALRKWWYRIGWMLTKSVIAQPFTRIPALWEAFRIMTTRTDEAPDPYTAEFLSLGVLPDFTNPKFVQESGLRIARELITQGVRVLTDTGAKRVTAVVDADNLPARMMYFGLGWTLSRSSVPGWRAPSVEFAWEIKDAK